MQTILATKRYTHVATEVLHYVLKHPDLCPTAKLLWCYLYSLAPSTTLQVSVRRKSLAEELNVTLATISRCLRQLYDHELLVPEATYYEDKNNCARRGSNLFHLTVPDQVAKCIIQEAPDRKKPSAVVALVKTPSAPRAPDETTHSAGRATDSSKRGANAMAALRTALRGKLTGQGVSKPAEVSRIETSEGLKNATAIINSEKTISETKPGSTASGELPAAKSSATNSVSFGLNQAVDTPYRRLITAYEQYATRRLLDLGKPLAMIPSLLEQFEFQLQRGFMADRPTVHAVNTLLKLVREQRYTTPRGYQAVA